MDAKYWLLGALAVSGDRTAPLVDGGVRGVAWLDDGSVVYGASAGGKTAWLRFDPASGTPAPAFDHKALAAAIDKANPKGKPADPDKLMAGGFKRDGDALRIDLRGSAYRCDAAGCAALAKPASGTETTRSWCGRRMATGSPPSSRTSARPAP